MDEGQTTAPHGIRKHLPILNRLPNYPARWLRADLLAGLVAFAGVMVLGTLQGIVAAVVVSMAALIYHANRPPVYAIGRKPGTGVFRPPADHPDDETFPGLLILRSEGILYFARTPRAIECYWAAIREAGAQVVVLECSAIPNIEYTALDLLSDFEEKLSEAGITLLLAALNPDVLQAVEASALGMRLIHERMFFTLQQAVEAYVEGPAGSEGRQTKLEKDSEDTL
jgi:SulP family sulfate permease